MITMTRNDEVINLDSLRESRQLRTGVIQAATEDTSYEIAADRAADPIKSVDDINAVVKYLLDRHRWRDHMLFVVGINFGLRVSDLRTLRFSHLIDENFRFRETFAVFEQKTRNTRKRKKNRYITINEAVIDAVTLYLENTPGVCLSDYMFRSESNRGKNSNNPMSARSFDRILKEIAENVGLTMKVSTHTLRKTFCYHQMLVSGNDSRKLLLLQKMMGHSSVAQTLDYIGITQEEIRDAYKELNLGAQPERKAIDTIIIERDAV